MSEKDNKFDYNDGVTLKEHFNSRLQAIEKASELATKLLEARLIKEQAGEFVTRNECGIRKQSVDSDIRILREYKSALEGKASHFYVTITFAIALLSLFVGIVGLLLKYHT